MERRKFMISVGSLAAGSAAAMGTGAFTSVSANRDVTVNVADDSDALLALSVSDGPNAAYADETGGTLEVAFDGSLTDGDGNPTGNGFNDEATTIVRNVFDITNQGTQTVYIWIDGLKASDSQTGLSMYTDGPAHGGSDYTLNGNGVDKSDPADELRLEPGETMEEVGFIVYGNPWDEDDIFDGDMTIVATAQSEL